MTKILACSDIHGDSNALTAIGNIALHERVDLILIAGDICANARYRRFIDLLPELADHGKCKVVFTPGNHDFWKQESNTRVEYNWATVGQVTTRKWRPVTCLVDETFMYGMDTHASNALRIYGTPWVPECGNWNWQKPISELMFDIPKDTDILLCHCPPHGYGDSVTSTSRIGSEALTQTIKRTPNLKYVFFGHCHEQGGYHGRIVHPNYGCDNSPVRITHLYNVACRDKNHHINLDAIRVIDLP